MMRGPWSSASICAGVALVTILGAGRPVFAAETIVDAGRLLFTVSPDDHARDKSGAPLVTRYELEVFFAGSNTLIESVDLGKPTPDDTGVVSLQLRPLLRVPLSPGVSYDAVVRAIGPGGIADSTRSNAFSLSPPPCAPWTSPSSIDLAFLGGVRAAHVRARPGCAWTATSHDTWLSIVFGRSGKGNGTVLLLAFPNAHRSVRNGSLTIAESMVRVNQDGTETSASDSRGNQAAHRRSVKALAVAIGLVVCAAVCFVVAFKVSAK